MLTDNNKRHHHHPDAITQRSVTHRIHSLIPHLIALLFITLSILLDQLKRHDSACICYPVLLLLLLFASWVALSMVVAAAAAAPIEQDECRSLRRIYDPLHSRLLFGCCCCCVHPLFSGLENNSQK